MFDLVRLRGVVAALAVVALGLSMWSLLARATAGVASRWLSEGDSTMEGGQDAVVGGRIAGVLAEARRRGGRPDADLGVLFGASSVGMAIDPTVLESAAGARIPARWLSLAANGANAEDLRGLADLLLTSVLHPRLLVLGFHPQMLARSDDYLSDQVRFDVTDLRRALAAGRLRTAQVELETLVVAPLNRAFPNRTRISHHIRGLAAEAKWRMFAALGLGVDSLFAPDPEPWVVRLLVEEHDAEPGAEPEGRRVSVRDQREGPMRERPGGAVRNKGWSNPASYAADGANARALIAIIRAARARGIEVVIALLPEATTLRNSVPPEAMRCLRAALDRGFGTAAPPVIDLRAAIPDSMFHDSIHPRRPGRLAATRLLVEALRARPEPDDRELKLTADPTPKSAGRRRGRGGTSSRASGGSHHRTMPASWGSRARRARGPRGTIGWRA
jgi:hypothetical protein